MSKQRTPQQKQAERHVKGRREANGRKATSSRSGVVALPKRLRNRAERRLAHAAFRPDLVLDEDGEALATALVRRKQRVPRWRKVPGEPLGVVARARWARRRAFALAGKTLRWMLFLTRGD